MSARPCRCGSVTSMSSSSRHGKNGREQQQQEGDAFIMTRQEAANSPLPAHRRPESDDAGGGDAWGEVVDGIKRVGVGALAGLFLMAGGDVAAAFGDVGVVEPTSSVTVQDLQRYDGFEDYAAQGQQMENSDVGCFANECKRETASCFTDGSCLKVLASCDLGCLCSRWLLLNSINKCVCVTFSDKDFVSTENVPQRYLSSTRLLCHAEPATALPLCTCLSLVSGTSLE